MARTLYAGVVALLARLLNRHPKRFRTRSVSLGKCLIGNLDNISEVLAIAEGEDYK